MGDITWDNDTAGFICKDERVKKVYMSYGGKPDEQGRLNNGVVINFKDGTEKRFYTRTTKRKEDLKESLNNSISQAEQYLLTLKQ